MSLFPSTLTGRILDDGATPPPVIELQGISAGQLATVLTAYTPQTEHTANTAAIGVNAAAIAALQGQVAALPAAPDLAPYALAADLAAAEGSILANASGLVAVNTSLTQGLAAKANQSALDALQVEVNGKSTPASVDLKLANHPTTAAMNSSIASTNNATLATVAANYALKSVVDQLAIDLAARQTAADVDQRVATALLSYVTQAAFDAALALRDGRLDGHDADILALQSAGPFALPSEITALQSAIDSILAEIATLGGATNLVNAPAWPGNVTFDLLAGTNQIRNLHAAGPLSIALANDNWTLSFACDAYSKAEADALLLPKASESWVLATLGNFYTVQEANDAITAALGNYFTRAEATANLVAGITECKDYTDTSLLDYSDTAATNQLIADALLTVTLSNGQSWADRKPSEGHERPAELVRGGCAHRHPAEPGRHDPHRIGQLRPRRDLHAARDGSRHHGGHRCAQPVPVPDRSPGAGAHRRGAGPVLGPDGGLQLRGRRAGQLPDQQPGELGHLLGSVELRRQQPGGLEDHHCPPGLLHAGRNGPGHRGRRDRRHGPVELLHHLRDAELRGQRAAVVLSQDRAGLAAHGHFHAVLDQRAHPNRDRRRHRRGGLPGPDGGGRPLLRESSRRGVGADFQPCAGAVHAPGGPQFAFGGAAGRRRDFGEPVHPAHPER